MQADIGLRRRREDRVGKLRGVHEARRQLDAAHGALRVVLLQAAAREIAADDAFDGEHLRLADEHEAATQIVGIRLELFGQIGDIG